MPTERKRRRRANGEGSIYQRASDAKWVGSAYVYTTKGVRKRRPVYGNSFDEVRGKLDKLKGDSANGVLLPDQNVLVRDYLNYWLQEVVAQKRLTTRRGYESAVRAYRAPRTFLTREIVRVWSLRARKLPASCRARVRRAGHRRFARATA